MSDPHHRGKRRTGARTAALALSTVLIAAAPAPFASAAPAVDAATAHASAFVDPFIGSANGGTTFPGATAPHGMIAWSP
ncbi:hypothetical protein, partial [Streptomyces beijiangensis]